MKKLLILIIAAAILGSTLPACHNTSQNTANPVASQAKDTAASRRDTSSVSTRADK